MKMWLDSADYDICSETFVFHKFASNDDIFDVFFK